MAENFPVCTQVNNRTLVLERVGGEVDWMTGAGGNADWFHNIVFPFNLSPPPQIHFIRALQLRPPLHPGCGPAAVGPGP